MEDAYNAFACNFLKELNSSFMFQNSGNGGNKISFSLQKDKAISVHKSCGKSIYVQISLVYKQIFFFKL